MRKSFVALLIALFWGTTLTYAQENPYVYNPDEDYAIPVKVRYGGKSPVISDFVVALWGDAEDEYSNSLITNWKMFINKQPLEEGTVIILDSRNGYFSCIDEQSDLDYKNKSVTELCYWNCSDGKHKLVATANNLFINGKPVEGQYTGLMFLVYENSTRRMWMVQAEDLGAVVKSENDYFSSGYDADSKSYFVEYANGKKQKMSQKEYDDWMENKRPRLTYSLPRQGKNIIISIHADGKVVEKELVWDGMRFTGK